MNRSLPNVILGGKVESIARVQSSQRFVTFQDLELQPLPEANPLKLLELIQKSSSMESLKC
jgi:hypothetical protein